MPGYNDFFRNTLVNYESATNHGLAFRYLFKKASLKDAAHDHTYTKLPFPEHWVDRALTVSAKHLYTSLNDKSLTNLLE